MEENILDMTKRIMKGDVIDRMMVAGIDELTMARVLRQISIELEGTVIGKTQERLREMYFERGICPECEDTGITATTDIGPDGEPKEIDCPVCTGTTLAKLRDMYDAFRAQIGGLGDEEEGGTPWCEACRSYHPSPRDEDHKKALMCKAPDTRIIKDDDVECSEDSDCNVCENEAFPGSEDDGLAVIENEGTVVLEPGLTCTGPTQLPKTSVPTVEGTVTVASGGTIISSGTIEAEGFDRGMDSWIMKCDGTYGPNPSEVGEKMTPCDMSDIIGDLIDGNWLGTTKEEIELIGRLVDVVRNGKVREPAVNGSDALIEKYCQMRRKIWIKQFGDQAVIDIIKDQLDMEILRSIILASLVIMPHDHDSQKYFGTVEMMKELRSNEIN